MNGVMAMDENGEELKSPMRRLGSTRKLLVFNNIRLQLNEQLRCLDVRVESQVSLIQELQDFFRRRGELELDYCKSLDKLAKSLQLRHKEQKQKREQWPMFSSYACWQQLVNQTKSLSKDHAALSEIYSVHVVSRLQTVIEDVQRIYKKCREIGYETHEEILRVLQELHTTMKTYHNYQTESKAAEAKLRTAEMQRMKLQQAIPKEKLERSKKYRLTEKEVLKRKNKYTDARLKALKAKNEYQLCLEASNTTIHKYFVEDLSDLIDCMDLGFGSMVSRAILMHVTADQGRCRALLQGAEGLSHIINSMDSRADKQKFLEQHHGAFMIPKRLEFQGQAGDEPIEPELQKALHKEMEQRLHLLGQRVNNLRAESEEIWKTLETAEINLLEYLNTKDYDTSSMFGDGTHSQPKNLEIATTKTKADKQEIEEFYITKIREYILGTSRIARLDAKAELLRNALAKDPAFTSAPLIKSNVPKRKRIGRMNISGQPKLFGGSLEEYLEVTGEEIPLIMRSCIRVINVFGLHHQGIFRVSGSQVEISNFREGFERGEDPLADTTDASDINSVAGVLKLYLRELREPLFPIIYFDHFVSLAQLDSKHDVVAGIKKFLLNLSRSVVIVIRYLFAFLNHLSEYSDENMMDAYNLAICFGPTLMPAPEDKDQVQYQNQVNELIKNMIVYHEELFPKDLGGLQYEKYISEEPFIDIDVGDSPTDQVAEDLDSEVYPSEDESDTLEATVQFDFNARSTRELSLRKGDPVILRKQVSNDWWQGTVNGKDGLVPDKYISLKIKDEDRDKNMKSSSSEESIRKRRPSGTISLSNQLSIFSSSTPHVNNHQLSISTSSSDPQPVMIVKNHLPNQSHQQQQQHQQQQIQRQQHHHQIHHNNDDQSIIAQHTQQQQVVHQLLNEKIDAIANNKLSSTNLNSGLISSSDNANDGDCDFHYDTVDNVKPKYHEEPHLFENSMDFLEDLNHFQYEKKSQPSEPIYAEPSKPMQRNSSNNLSTCPSPPKPISTNDLHFNEYEGVVLRNDPISTKLQRKSETIKTNSDCSNSNNEINRHSDGNIFKQIGINVNSSSGIGDGGGNDGSDIIGGICSGDEILSPTRKYHTKSLSVCENRNLFLQNKELWEKRVELSSQHSLNQSSILERKRIAPDLVMDLPLSANKDLVLGNSSDSLDLDQITTVDELTSAERFASQNQCTLKKNERFSTSSSETSSIDKKEIKLECSIIEKPKAEVKPQPQPIDISAINEKKSIMEEILHIDEDIKDSKDSSLAPPSSAVGPKNLSNSPIPARNTQKFISQFADLKLTGGCLNQTETTIHSQQNQAQCSSSSSAGASGGAGGGINISCSSIIHELTSFKPQVKIKPNIFKKPPFVRPPTTPEMSRRTNGNDFNSHNE